MIDPRVKLNIGAVNDVIERYRLRGVRLIERQHPPADRNVDPTVVAELAVDVGTARADAVAITCAKTVNGRPAG